MTIDIAAVRTAMAAKLADLNIRAYHYAPDQPTAPAAFVFPQPGPYDVTYDNGADLLMVVRYLVQSVNNQAGQDQLDGFLSQDGPTSGKVKLEADQTLNGTCQNVRVTSFRNYGAVDIAGSPVGGGTIRYLSAEQVVSIFL